MKKSNRMLEEQRAKTLVSLSKKSLVEKLVFESRPKRGKGMSCVYLAGGRNDRGNECRGPEAGIHLVCLRNRKEVSVAGVGRVVGWRSEKLGKIQTS